MTDTASTFVDYYVATADPDDFASLGAIYNNLRAEVAAGQPQPLFATLPTTSYPYTYMYLNAADNLPCIAIAPFKFPAAPGAAAVNDIHFFGGDFTAAGAEPQKIMLTADAMHLTTGTNLPNDGDMTGLFAALDPADHLLAPVANGAGADNVVTRRLILVPPEFSVGIIQCAGNGQLTQQWLWDNTCEAIVTAGGDKLNALRDYIDFVKGMSTQRPPGAAGDPARPPEAAIAPTVPLNFTPAQSDAFS